MSVAQEKALVFLLTVAPLVVVALWSLFATQYSITPSKAILLLYYLLYVYAVRWIADPYLRLLGFLHLPRPSDRSFIFGNTGPILQDPHGRQTFSTWIDTIPNSGIIYFSGYFYAFHNVLLTTPEALQDVLVSNSYDWEKSPSLRKLLARTIGRGLVTVEGAEHKAQRKSVNPAFSGKHIRDLVPLFWSKSQDLAKVIADKLDVVCSEPTAGNEGKEGRTGIVEINQWASRATLDIIGLACVGRDFGSIYNSNDEFIQQYNKIVKTDNGGSILSMVLDTLSIILPIHVARWMPFSSRIREASDGRLVEVKRRDMETESEKQIDILSVLIRSGQFSDDGLVDQLLTFLAAGHETTSSALTWSCWLLAINSGVQDRLRAELRGYFAHSNDLTITAASLENLPYLDAITNEQLRVMPPVPVSSRAAIRDTTILGQHIPKGSHVVFSPWAINRSKKLWGPDAEDFKPERWLSDGQGGLGGSKSPLSLLTFLHGPRSCIGQAFTRAELKCLLAAMVLKFKMHMADPSEVIEPAGLLTIKPKNGLRLRLTEL
ncbi:hypothetical protein LTR36_006658 [Oleoguttula mirabilis]|uniref:Cytochrome P450 n=1 Tax=Oleoguttula mirabilis TaxID=1507867 RepID=A0AAV9JDY7_9PEZI|nr:hypothetical protein LTR36_006658 [Oleoguttula mirabilis]